VERKHKCLLDEAFLYIEEHAKLTTDSSPNARGRRRGYARPSS